MTKFVMDLMKFYGIENYNQYEVVQNRYDHILIRHKVTKQQLALRY